MLRLKAPGIISWAWRSSLPTVEKHLIPPLNNWFRSGRSDGGSNLLTATLTDLDVIS